MVMGQAILLCKEDAIGPADSGRLMTLEEFQEADVEEGYRYELAQGSWKCLRCRTIHTAQLYGSFFDSSQSLT